MEDAAAEVEGRREVVEGGRGMWEDRCGVVECGWEMVEGEGAEFAGDWEILENGGTGPGGGRDRVSGGRKMAENGKPS